MSELFSPSHFIWIVPLGFFGIFIIVATCYFLRREITAFLQRMFFPDTKRYIMPAGIISNVATGKSDGPLTPEQLDKIAEVMATLPVDETGAVTIPKEHKIAHESAAKHAQHKKPDSLLRRIEIKLRLKFRKLKHNIKVWFAEFAGTEDSPSKRLGQPIIPVKKEEPKQEPILPVKEEPAKVQKDKAKPAQEEIKPEPAPEPKPVEIKEPVKVMAAAVAKENPEPEQKKEEPAPIKEEPKAEKAVTDKADLKEETKIKVSSVKEDKKADKPAKTDKKPFLSDRTAIIIALLILACFMIFLAARVKLLGSMVMRQRVEIQNLKTQIEMLRYEQRGYKVVIHNRTTITQKRYNK